MSAKHTPGPWKVIETHCLPHEGDHVADMSNGLMVVPVLGRLGDALADARLIAASPCLLEALKDCRRALEVSGYTQELAIVDAAIAKAEGP